MEENIQKLAMRLAKYSAGVEADVAEGVIIDYLEKHPMVTLDNIVIVCEESLSMDKYTKRYNFSKPLFIIRKESKI